MFTVSTEIIVKATPEAVWELLVDVSDYRTWHPFVELEGVLDAGNEIEYFFRLDPNKPRKLSIPATVTQVEGPLRFSLRLGITGICMIEQWYVLDEVPNGTRVTHGSDLRGILPFLAERLSRRRLLFFHQAPLDGLIRRLDTIRLSGLKSAPPKPRVPRRGFRGYRG